MRPNIAYAILIISRYALNPIKNYHGAVNYIFRYLRGIYTHNLVFREDLASIIGYSNADFTKNTFTRRFISDYYFSLRSAAISWSSKRQDYITLYIYKT